MGKACLYKVKYELIRELSEEEVKRLLKILRRFEIDPNESHPSYYIPEDFEEEEIDVKEFNTEMQLLKSLEGEEIMISY